MISWHYEGPLEGIIMKLDKLSHRYLIIWVKSFKIPLELEMCWRWCVRKEMELPTKWKNLETGFLTTANIRACRTQHPSTLELCRLVLAPSITALIQFHPVQNVNSWNYNLKKKSIQFQCCCFSDSMRWIMDIVAVALWVVDGNIVKVGCRQESGKVQKFMRA